MKSGVAEERGRESEKALGVLKKHAQAVMYLEETGA